MVPACSSVFATATSSSDRRTTAFCVSAYVAMRSLRRPLYRNISGSAGRVDHKPATGTMKRALTATAEQTQRERGQSPRQRDPGGLQDPPGAAGRKALRRGVTAVLQ